MTEKKPRDLFWFWVIAAFLMVIAAWTTIIIIASNNPNPQIELSD